MGKKSFLATILILAMSLGFSTSIFASERDLVTEEEAYNVAVNFIMGM